MTLIAAWCVGKGTNNPSLIIAADSCLSGGERWKCCPKIFPLNRNDSAICFSGETFYAYPLILQLINFLNMHPKVKNRASDITEIKAYILQLLNSMIKERSNFPSTGPSKPDVSILFCGYSWRYNKLVGWRFYYTDNEFSHKEVIDSHKSKKNFTFMGDYEMEVKNKLISMCTHRRQKINKIQSEPLDILKEYINNHTYDTIDGPVQMIRIYKHMNVLPFNIIVNGSDGKKHIYFYGRELKEYEKNEYLTLDLDSKDVYSFIFDQQCKKLYNINAL